MMKKIQLDGPLVGVNWLKEHLGNDDLIILDATLPKAVKNDGEDGVSNHKIPGALFFDIKNGFSDASATYPNTWPGEHVFNQSAKELGINNSSTIVVYDDHGIYSSARAWWMFRAMGHQKVAVLNGGLPAWVAAGFKVVDKTVTTPLEGDFKGLYDSNFFSDHKDVLGQLTDIEKIVIDARANNRFLGLVEEPRKGLRSGHIPGSLNLPYTDLLLNGKMLVERELKKVMDPKISKDKRVIFSCGSGVTACVLALGAELSGYKHLSVYDGSWTEWGSMPELPIEKEKQ